MKRRHFVLVNQTLGPFFQATASALVTRGHRVTILVGHHASVAIPGATILEGPAYKRRNLRERAASWLAYLKFVRTTLRTLDETAVVLSSSNPPLLPHVVSWCAPKGVRHVARVLDIYPEVLRAHKQTRRLSILEPIWHWFNRLTYRRCAAVVTLGEEMARTLQPSVTSPSVVIIPDWHTLDAGAVPDRDDNQLRRELGLSDRLIVLYSGNLGLAHDLSLLVDAAAEFRTSGNVAFVVIGEGPQRERLEARVAASGLGGLFRFLPYQPRERLPLSMGLGDFSVVTVGAGAERTLMPCKTYDYLAAGSAVLAIVRQPSDLAAVIEQHQCGVVVEPGDLQGIVTALKRALAEADWLQGMRQRAKRAAVDCFSADVQCTRLVSLLEDVADRVPA